MRRLRPSWMRDAACRNPEDPQTFKFYPTNQWGRCDERAAKAICSGCPVKRECLDFALAGQEQGIWGMTTVEERNVILRRRRYARAS